MATPSKPPPRPFRRRSPPPPGARKLLLGSLVSTLVLAAALTAVFLPRLLTWEGEDRGPTLQFEVVEPGRDAVRVTGTDVERDLGAFRVELWVDGQARPPANLTALACDGSGSPPVTFCDAPALGKLGGGDVIGVAVEPGHVYRLLVTYVPRDVVVLYQEWSP